MKKLTSVMLGVVFLVLSCAHTQESNSYSSAEWRKAQQRYEWGQRH